MHGIAPPAVAGFINLKYTANTATRGAAKGDWKILQRKTILSHTVFSCRASHQWNLNATNYSFKDNFVKCPSEK